jgi:(2Fe-2S) ferredoxin
LYGKLLLHPAGTGPTRSFIQKFIERHGLQERVDLVGRLCTGQCKSGPNVIFNGEAKRNVTPEVLSDLLQHYLKVQ